MKTFTDAQRFWFLALALAGCQISLASYAVYSSNLDVLSDGACIGGGFGTLANLVILGVTLIWLIVLAVRSSGQAKWHTGIPPLMSVALSSTTAILIGLYAALRCTV